MPSSFSPALPLLVATFALPARARPQEGADAPQERVFTDAQGRPRVRVRETLIGFNDPAMNEESFVASPDGRRVGYMVMSGDSLAVVVDGVKGEIFEGIAHESFSFSADGKRFGYVATRPGSQFAVVDGRSYEYRGVTRQGVVFAPVGSRVAWVGLRSGEQVAVVDEKESAPYDAIMNPGVVFGPDGERYAFAALNGGKALVVVDGEEGPLFDSVAGLRFTANARHVTYLAVREGKRFVVVDTNVYGPYDELHVLGNAEKSDNPMLDVLEVSADGSRVAFAASRGEQWYVVVEGREHGPYEQCAGLSLSPEGSRMAFLATRGEGWMMVVDGEERPGSGLRSLSFSPDGKRLASIVKHDEKHHALIDGVEGPAYDHIEEPGIRFSHDGAHTAYLATIDGEHTVVVDGQEGPRFKRLGKTPLAFVPGSSKVMYSVRRGDGEALVVGDLEGPKVASLRSLCFSPDGERHAYAAELGGDRWVAVVDGALYGPGGRLAPDDEHAYQSLGKRTPLFSPDGKHAAWVAVRDTGWVAVVDGVESRPFSLVMRSTLDFSPDSQHVAFIAARNGKKMIVVDDFEIDGGWDGFLGKSDLVWDGSRKFSIRGTRDPKYLLIEVELL